MKVMLAVLAVLCISLSSASIHAEEAKAKTLYHVVCFKFNEDAKPEQIQKIETDFRALKDKIPQVLTYSGGANFNVEKGKGFKHCSVLTFKSEEDLKTYIASEPHQEFVKLIKECVADAFVMDYWN